MSEDRTQLTLNAGEEPQWDEVYQRISWWDADAIAQAWVLVVGAGALGNEVLKNLALLGVGHIVLLDFDHIEYSNLSRSVLFRDADCGRSKAEVAAERVREINPGVEIIPLHGDVIYDIGLGLIGRMHVVIGCLDNRIARLYINRHCYKMNRIWVDGGIENLAGRMDVFIPGQTCYECQLTEREWAVIDKRMSCSDVAQRNANFGRIPTTPISSSIIAAMQVLEAMKVIFDNKDKLLRGKRFFMEGMSNEIMFYNSYALKEDCGSHSTYEDVIPSTISCEDTLKTALEKLRQLGKGDQVKILLSYGVATRLVTKKSEEVIDLIIPLPRITNKLITQYEKIPGEGLATPQNAIETVLSADFPVQNKTLQELGIPPLQIITVETADDLLLVELSADRERFFPGLPERIRINEN